MRKIFFICLTSLMMTTAFSQSEKYVNAMEGKVNLLDSATTPDVLKELANTFERIGNAEKTQWLPFYYAAYCNVMAGTFSLPQDGSFGDNSAITDPYADKAEALLNKAIEIAKGNTEIYCVQKMIHGLRMMGNAMARFMTEGPLAEAALEKAKEANAGNPRIYILEAQDKFYTPEQFGGSKAEAKILFEKAQGLFETYKPESTIHPNWGLPTTKYFLSQLK
jgi:hypothetical protein